MAESAATSNPPQDTIRIRRSRLRKLARTGCIPFALLAPCAVVGFINLVAFWRAPSWVNDPRTYLLSNRLIVSLITLALMQIVAHWMMGLIAANSGASIVRGGGQWLRARLRISSKQSRVAAIAVIVVRLLLLMALVISILFAITRLFGPALSWSFVEDVFDALASLPLLAVLSVTFLLIQWLIGPLLRMRYSAALGMLAGTWATRTQERTWYAFTARLGAGLVGILSLVWGGALIILLVSSIFDPTYSSTSNYPTLFFRQPGYVREILGVMLFAVISVPLYMLGQVILPEVYLQLAQRRLEAQKNPLPEGQGT